MKAKRGRKLGTWIISVNDGFVEYEYEFEGMEGNSINDVIGLIYKSLISSDMLKVVPVGKMRAAPEDAK